MKVTPEILDKLPPAGAFCILDLSSWARAAYEGARAKGVNVDDEQSLLVVRSVLGRLWDVVALPRHEPGYLAIAVDVIGDEAGRALIWPGYKAGRTPPGPGYARQIGILLEVFAALRIPVFQASGFEADDYAAALCRRARFCGLRVVLLAADHDLWQLFDDEDPGAVVAWDVGGARLHTSDTCRSVYGVPPSRLVDLMALTGDGDEAPGIKGLGPKKGAAILERHGSLDRALANWSQEKGKIGEWLRDGAEAARMSRDLVRLRVGAPVHASLGACALGWSDDDTMRVWRLARRFQSRITELSEVRTNPKRHVPRELEQQWIAAGAALEIEAGPGAWKTEPEIPNALIARYLAAAPDQAPGAFPIEQESQAGAPEEPAPPSEPAPSAVQLAPVVEAPPSPPGNDLEPIPLEPAPRAAEGTKKGGKVPKGHKATGPKAGPAKAAPAAPARDDRQLGFGW
jgi:5'-3' exonuclease